MGTELLLTIQIPSKQPADMFVHIYRDTDNGGIIGTVLYNNQAKVFKPKICDLDKGWWRRMMFLVDAGYGL